MTPAEPPHDLQKSLGDLALPASFVRPERVLRLDSVVVSNHPEQVVEVPLGVTFDVEVDPDGADGQVWCSDHVGLLLPDRQGLQCERMTPVRLPRLRPPLPRSV